MAIRNSSGQIKGIIQLVTKFEDLPFTKKDENIVEAIAIFFDMGLRSAHIYQNAVDASYWSQHHHHL